jgi:hypothetical protein
MNAEFVKKALGKVLNPHVLVNIVSKRVRQKSAWKHWRAEVRKNIVS